MKRTDLNLCIKNFNVLNQHKVIHNSKVGHKMFYFIVFFYNIVFNETLTSFSQSLHKVFLLWSICTFWTKICSYLGQTLSDSWAVWWLNVPIMSVLTYHSLNRWMWQLQGSGSCSQGWTRLVQLHNSPPDVGFLLTFHTCRKRKLCFRCGLKYSQMSPSNLLGYVS